MRILIPLANGFEEIEAITVLDVLRRAGMDVVTAGLPGTMISGMKGLSIKTDTKLEDINTDDFDALVLVGGAPGYQNLGKSESIMKAILSFDEKKKTIGAICMAPTLLAKAGILDDRRAAVYPGAEREIPRPRNGRVVVDGNIITSQGPGTAMEFALKLVEVLAGESKAQELKREMCC